MDILKILILEDFESDVELIKREIRLNLNYKVDFKWVIKRDEFIKALKEYYPDIILSDYNLPQFNGIEALQLSVSFNDLIPFIIVTGSLDEETAAGSIREGAWDYIVKERLHRLPGAIENALRLKKEKLKARKAQTELELIKNKSGIQLKLLFNAIDNAPSSFVITNADGIIQYVNPFFEQVTGYKAEEVVGENPRILKSGIQDKYFYQNMWNTISHGETFKGEMVNKKKNGELYWETVSISPIKNEIGEIEHYVAVKRDITENKKFLQSLEESENWYRTIFENTGTASIIVNEKGEIILANSKFEDLSRMKNDEIIGKIKWMDFVPEPDKSMMINYQKKRL
ncbi:MAG: PAS domain S-box protein, partial [Prolixibacteraceae bacterium]|nr:PAS domain S-box protein [Prolixibacteraceae bacterium]